jgi:hypothetical protein
MANDYAIEWRAAAPGVASIEYGHNEGQSIRLLRNSTKIAAQFLGLGQCSQKAPD